MPPLTPHSALGTPHSAARDVLGLLLLSGWLVFVNLGEPNLGEPDEPRSALIARVMVDRGDWLVPHLPILYHHEHPLPPIERGLRVYLYKPPLFFWLEALAMKIVGPTALAARLPSALSQVAAVGLVYLTGAGLGGRAAALAAAGLYAVAPMPIFLGRLARLEATLVAVMTLSLAAILRLLARGDGTWRWAMVLAGAAALGALAKSPFTLAIPLIALAVTLGLSHRGDLVRRFHPLTAAAVCVVLAAPWFVYMHWRYPPAADGSVGGFAREFFVRQHLARVTSDELGHSKPPGFQLAALLVGFLPWSVFLPGACVRGVARAWRERRERPALLFLFAWVAVIVVIFSLSRTQLPHYVAPALPAGALLVGLYVAERLRAPERAFLVEIAAILAIEAVGLALVVAGMAREGAWRWAYLAPVAITAAALASAGLLCRRDPAKLRGALALAVAAMALISTFLLATDPFRVYEARSTRPEALFAQRDARPGDAVLLYPNIPFSYAWTVWPQTVPCAERLGELVAALNRPQRTIVFSREKDVLDDLRPRVRWPIQVLLRTRKGILFATVPTEAPHARDEPAPP